MAGGSQNIMKTKICYCSFLLGHPLIITDTKKFSNKFLFIAILLGKYLKVFVFFHNHVWKKTAIILETEDDLKLLIQG